MYERRKGEKPEKLGKVNGKPDKMLQITCLTRFNEQLHFSAPSVSNTEKNRKENQKFPPHPSLNGLDSVTSSANRKLEFPRSTPYHGNDPS